MSLLSLFNDPFVPRVNGPGVCLVEGAHHCEVCFQTVGKEDNGYRLRRVAFFQNTGHPSCREPCRCEVGKFRLRTAEGNEDLLLRFLPDWTTSHKDCVTTLQPQKALPNRPLSSRTISGILALFRFLFLVGT
jgi:hypothetical protein